MEDKKQNVPNSDPPPYSEVATYPQPEPVIKSKCDENQPPEHQNLQQGYSYEAGYHPVSAPVGYPSQSYIQATPQTNAFTKDHPHPQIVVNQPIGNQTPVVVATYERPPDCLLPAIIACICCCFPIGVFAVCFAIRAQTLAAKGEMEEAMATYRTARCLVMFSVVVGIIMIVVTVVMRQNGTIHI